MELGPHEIVKGLNSRGEVAITVPIGYEDDGIDVVDLPCYAWRKNVKVHTDDQETGLVLARELAQKIGDLFYNSDTWYYPEELLFTVILAEEEHYDKDDEKVLTPITYYGVTTENLSLIGYTCFEAIFKAYGQKAFGE